MGSETCECRLLLASRRVIARVRETRILLALSLSVSRRRGIMDAIPAAERSSSSLATVFKISLYSLVCLASLALALGEESAFPTGLTIPLAIAAFFLNEQLGVLRLSPGWSSLF